MDEKKVREAIEDLKGIAFKCEGILESLPSKEIERSAYKNIPQSIYIAIEALEKQLPKKPIDKSCVKDNDTICGYIGICPSCNGIVDDSMIVCDCTQVLDWQE